MIEFPVPSPHPKMPKGLELYNNVELIGNPLACPGISVLMLSNYESGVDVQTSDIPVTFLSLVA